MLDRYRLTIDDEKNFFDLFAETNLDFSGCTLHEVIITPAENLWEICIITEKNFDKQILKDAEKFLQERYHAEVEIRGKSTVGNEPVARNKEPVRNKFQGTRNKFFEPVAISSINEHSGAVTIVGEIGAGDRNGVKLQEFTSRTKLTAFYAKNFSSLTKNPTLKLSSTNSKRVR